jgi:CheY-like chemotaxis protein
MAARTLVPPVVYVPCETVDDDRLVVDLRPTRDGERCLLVYTALDRLIDGCGEHQPWAALPVEALEQVREETHFDMILFDVVVPEDKRRKAV